MGLTDAVRVGYAVDVEVCHYVVGHRGASEGEDSEDGLHLGMVGEVKDLFGVKTSSKIKE